MAPSAHCNGHMWPTSNGGCPYSITFHPYTMFVFPSYRLVSNISYCSKLIEKIAHRQLWRYVESTPMLETLQSVYRANHSTETALLKVKTDLLNNIQNQEVSCLILLDLSAAFDTISQSNLVNRLKYRFGIDGTALEWINSYLSNRNQCVVLPLECGSSNVTSSSRPLRQGVPQGSVLGPSLFSLYISPLGDICQKHDVDCHGYADNRQLYLSFKPKILTSKENCIRVLENCIADIRIWMRMNLIKLNDGKTKFIIIGTRQQLKLVGDIEIRIGTDNVKPTPWVRNLGYFYDSELKGHIHVAKLVSSTFITICRISRVRHLLNNDTCKTLMQALVLSKLNYCNSLLLGMPKYLLHCLQKIQNMASRVINNHRKYDSVTEDMKNLHWLKIPERVDYKVAVLIFQCINNQALTYLKALLNIDHNRSLRSSSSSMLLPVSMSRLSIVHNSSFSICGPRIWNELPIEVKRCSNINDFKCKLKTYMFQ